MLRIEIHGPTCSGRTTLSLAIEEFLKENFFSDVTNNDEDVIAKTYYGAKNLKSLRDEKIEIETICDNGLK
jgi:hypothetical protein